MLLHARAARPTEYTLAGAETAMTEYDPLVGRILRGTHRLEHRMGAGGMGLVYAATDVRSGHACAVKLLRSHAGVFDAALVARFRREADVLARLRDPAVAAFHEFAQEDNGAPFLVMELLAGRSLASRLAREGGLRWVEARRIVLEVARVLGLAHRAGIVHRDIKPANVFLARPDPPASLERVVVLDFGIAHVASADPRLTATGMLVGTPAYLAPEQAQGHVVDARADVYALGALLFEVVTGRPALDARSLGDAMLAVLGAAPPALEPVAAGRVPAGIDAVVARAMTKDPAGRFAGTDSFAAAVAALPEPTDHLGFDDTLWAGRSMPGAAATPAPVAALTPDPRTGPDNRVSTSSGASLAHTLLSAPPHPAPTAAYTPAPYAPAATALRPGARRGIVAASLLGVALVGLALVVALALRGRERAHDAAIEAPVAASAPQLASPAGPAPSGTTAPPAGSPATGLRFPAGAGVSFPAGTGVRIPASGPPPADTQLLMRVLAQQNNGDFRGCIESSHAAPHDATVRGVAWSCALHARDYDEARRICALDRAETPGSERAQICEATIQGEERSHPVER